MSGEAWPQVALGEVLEPISRLEVVDPDREYRLLGVRWYARGCHEQERLLGAKLKTAKLNRIEQNDVVYNKMWTTKSAFAVAGLEHAGCYATSEYPLFRINEARLCPEFLTQVFEGADLTAQASALCRGTTSRARLHPRDFLRLTCPLPPLDEQRRLAGVLSRVDEFVAKTRSVAEGIERVRNALIKELLGRTASERTEQGRSGWNVRAVGELCDFSGGHGFTPRDWSESGLPIIRIQNLNGASDFHYFNGPPEPAWIIEPGDLLFAWAGSRGSSFGPCLWPGPRGVLNQHIHKLVPKPDVDKRFLYYLLKAVTVEVEQRAHGFKDSLVHLRKGELTEFRVGVPDLPRQRELAAKLYAVEDAARIEATAALAAATLKRSLAEDLLY